MKKTVAILQNQWFKDPARVQRMLDGPENLADPERREEVRRRLIHYALFAGCKTGRIIKKHFGDVTDHIIWEEASPRIGGKASDNFGFDIDHIAKVIETENPTIILVFGKVAELGMQTAFMTYNRLKRPDYTFIMPHPAARQAGTEQIIKNTAQMYRAMQGLK